MQLFRGDKIFNDKTEPDLYRADGIRSKSFGGGSSPTNIEKIGLINSIKAHIQPYLNNERQYYDVTDFISFSASRERALYWLTDRGALKVKPSIEYQETRYLFNFEIEDNKLVNLSSGIYILFYSCNPKLKKSNSGKSPHNELIEFQSENEVCELCSNVNLHHRLILINSYEYLLDNPNHANLDKAIKFAKDDEEWLLLPYDTIGKFRSSRIPRSNMWNVEHFEVTGEIRPEKYRI